MFQPYLSVVELLKILTNIFGGIFTGCALYATLVEIPSRRDLPSTSRWEQWRNSFLRGAKLQPMMSFLSAASSGGLYYLTRKTAPYPQLWLAAPIAFVIVMVYTFLFMLPEIKILLDKDVLNKKVTELFKERLLNVCVDDCGANSMGVTWVKEAVARWGTRHMFRTFVQGVAFIITLYASVKC